MAATTGTLTDASPDSAVITLSATDPHVEVFDMQQYDQVKLVHSINGDPEADQNAYVFNSSGKIQIKSEIGDKIQFFGHFSRADATRSVTYELRS